MTRKRVDLTPLRAAILLRKVAPEYRGWVAAVMFWRFCPSCGEAGGTGWSEFRRTHIPRDIPLDLDDEVMEAECEQLGIEFTLKNCVKRTESPNAMRRKHDANPRESSILTPNPTEDYYDLPGARKTWG